MTMYIETTSPVPFGAVFSLRVVNFFDKTVSNMIEWNASRKTTKALSTLTSRQLEDIGLTPYDIKFPAHSARLR